ncbi:SpoIIE family protein phosphatase [Eisenibacter elegans]|uniref:SpoIIE family protein phosphatase n=1 Tax=Eisenibacter elegans TaxID=997 RepID=UPI0003FF43FF
MPNSEARAFNELGVAYQQLQDYHRAEEFLQLGLAIRRHYQNQQGVITSLLNLGELYTVLGKYETAESYLSESLTLADKVKIKAKIQRAHQLLAQLYKAQGRLAQALEAYEQYMEVKTAFMKEEQRLQMDNLRAVFQVEQAKQDAEIERLKTVEIRQAYAKIESQNKHILDSIRYAERIQRAILPPVKYIQNYSDNAFIYYQPKDIVSGDFYWISEVAPNETCEHWRVVIAAIDCTGHGVPGAFMVVMAHGLLNDIVRNQGITAPAKILATLDQKVVEYLHQQEDKTNHDGMDMAVMVFDFNQQTLQFAGAKNPLYIVRNQEISSIKGSPYPIGGTQYGQKQFEEHTLQLLPEDTYYIVTDGFQDQFGGAENRKFLKSNFRNLLLSISQLPIPEQQAALKQTFEQWKGSQEQTDDVLVIGVKV